MISKIAKRKADEMLADTQESTSTPSPTPSKSESPETPKSKSNSKSPKSQLTTTQLQQKYLHRISLHPTLTPFRRRVYRVLLSVPPGRWTTYSAMATYLKSSARAVGNAMRTNPFAPEVPCHRVLAADGSLGGYKGEGFVKKDIGVGSFRDEKRIRLKEEGVGFDSTGKASGICFTDFKDLGGKE